MRTDRFTIPGAGTDLAYLRSVSGRLVELGCRGRVYLRERDDGARVFDSGLAAVWEEREERQFRRRVQAAGTEWTEDYRWDDAGRPAQVDGVDVERDERGWVISCSSGERRWRYEYDASGVVKIESPSGVRRISRDENRPVAIQDEAGRFVLAYDGEGRRWDTLEIPRNWHRDDLGRLWTVADESGRIATTFLWDGYNCLGRIDGAPGEPLAAVFSLDSTSTPVRVITAGGVRKIARDAFGETLLAERGVPGLFGGAIHDGLVHFVARSFDPRAGAFTAPDPCSGEKRDPRRGGGDPGPLWVETAGGPYAICQNDPIGRMDPTGAFSWCVLLSDFTWSLQNNAIAFAGLELTINFLGSVLGTLVTGIGKIFGANLQLGRSTSFFENPFDIRTGKRQDTWALRRDGIVSYGEPAYTFQHLFYSSKEALDGLDIGRLIDPKADFPATFYGSVLLAVPTGKPPVILGGDRTLPGVATLAGWTRAGGIGVPVFPGSNIPRFPSGGLHLDEFQPDWRGGDACDLTELTPSGLVALGNMRPRPRLRIPRVGLVVDPNDFILLTDSKNRSVIVAIEIGGERNGGTDIWLEEDPAGIDRTGLRLRTLSPVISTEDIPRATSVRLLNLAAIATPQVPPPDYVAGDPVRFSDPATATVTGVGEIATFETSLQLDAALPPLSAPLRVQRAAPVPVGQATVIEDTVLEFPAGTAPAPDEALLITAGAATIAVVVVRDDALPAEQRRLDRGTGIAPTTVVDWARLPGTDIGRREKAVDPATADVLTYVPDLERTAPPVNEHVLVIETKSSPKLAARRVTAVIHDALVFKEDLPAVPAGDVRVERFAFSGVDETGVKIELFQSVTLPAPTAFAGPVLQILDRGAVPPAPNPVGSSIAVDPAGFAVLPPTGVAMPPVRPSMLVQLTQVGAAAEDRVVRRVLQDIQIDRPLTVLAGVAGLEVARLQPGGPVYNATPIATDQLLALPQIGAVPVAVAMPHFLAGELVQLDWTTPTVERRFCRITAVEPNGTLLTLTPDPQIPANATGLTIFRLDLGWDVTAAAIQPVDLGFGGSVSGRVAAFNPAGNVLRTEVWQTIAFNLGDIIAIFSAADSEVAQINGGGAVVVEFATPSALVPSAASPVNIAEDVGADAGFSAEFEMEGNNAVVRLDELSFTPAVTPTQVALVEFSVQGATATGQISPGTTLVPDDPENWELDRRQSVIDHELTHTFQSAQLGPLLFGLFPTFIFRIVTEMTSSTEFELPKFSAYADGEITDEGRGRFLKIPEMHGIPFKDGDIIQVSQRIEPNQIFLVEIVSQESNTRFRISSTPQATIGPVLVRPVSLGAMLSGDVKQVGPDRVLDIPDPQGVTFAIGSLAHVEVHEASGAMTLGKRGEGNVFAITAGAEIPNGAVRVRREKSGNNIWKKIFQLAELLTPGELATRVAGLTWGNLIYFAVRGFYALFSGRKDRRHRATVSDDHRSLNCGAALPDDLREVSRVVIYSATGTIIRNVTKTTGAVLELSSAIEFAGEVQVAAYERRSGAGKYDWNTYYPASVPDPGRPNAIKIEEAGGEPLKLDPFDRVLLVAGSKSVSTRVTAVSADGLVELEDRPPTSGEERTLQVSFLDFETPGGELGSFDSRALNHLLNPTRVTPPIGRFIRLIFDPWGQLDYRFHPSGKFLHWLTRVARWGFSSHSWSLIFPGWFLWDNARRQKPFGDSGHLAQMEQDASASSGDLYAPMSRLRPRGEASLEFVGDIGRFWFWPWNSSLTDFRKVLTTLVAGRQDAPGIHFGLRDTPLVLPSITDTAGATDLNRATALANSGLQAPDLLVFKNFTNPAIAASPAALQDLLGTNPAGFVASPLAWIPTSPKLERALGIYAAFTTPGKHRVTVSNDIDMDREAREAHDGDTTYFFPHRQPIFFTVEVKDVTVAVAGQPALEGGTITLVQTQRARIAAEQRDGRQYVTRLLRPVTGPALQLAPDDAETLVAFAPSVGEIVEVNRRHAPDAAIFNPHGLHMARDIHIPVRRFTAQIVDVIPVRRPLPDAAALAADFQNANVVPALLPGEEAFLIVPTQVNSRLTLRSVNGVPTAVNDPRPDESSPTIDISALNAFLGDEGSVNQIAFAANEPPEELLNLEYTLDAGRTGNAATLRVAVQYAPHFRLLAAAFDVVRNPPNNATIDLRAEDGAANPVNVSTATVTPSAETEVTIAGNIVTITVRPAAASGPRRVLVEDGSTPPRSARRTINVL